MKYWRAFFLVKNLSVLGSKKKWEEAPHGSYLNKGCFGRFIKSLPKPKPI